MDYRIVGEKEPAEFYNVSRTGAETNQKTSDGLLHKNSLRSRELIRSVVVRRRCAGSHAIGRDLLTVEGTLWWGSIRF
jgi:hypothetical protein